MPEPDQIKLPQRDTVQHIRDLVDEALQLAQFYELPVYADLSDARNWLDDALEGKL